LATELIAAAICSGVTPIWYPIDTDASAPSVHLSARVTIPAFSPGKSRDTDRPKPNRSTYWLSRSVPTLKPILIAPTLLDSTMTFSNDRTP
jgi:hypothetical protein